MKSIYSSATRITLLTMTAAVIYMSIAGIEINETLKTSYQMVLAFYFGQRIGNVVESSKLG